MKKKMLSLVLGVAFAVVSSGASASNLWEIYQQAEKSDPQFQAALAQQMSVAEQFPQARAVLLPQITSPSYLNYSRTTYESDEPYTTSGEYANMTHYTSKTRTSNLQLLVKQSVFNFTNWSKLVQARDTVKAASATYNSAILDLMTRVCNAYLAVLQAQDVLRFSIAEKQAYAQEYERAKQNFHVGVATITDVYNAKAYYDTSSSAYITALNEVRNKREDLRAITGIFYTSLNPLKVEIPLIMPAPANMEQWVQTAIKQNWDITAARFTALAMHKSVFAARGGHLPTLDAQAAYNNKFMRTYDGVGWDRAKGPSAELDLAIPIYQGGMVNSQVRQALANYEKAQQDRETKTRQVVDNTRKAYLGILSGIDTVRADKQVVISNQSSLDGMQAGYRVGTRTIVDVLIAQKQLYNSQKEYAIARYNYIKSIILLKQNAGTLSDDDIRSINNWLTLTGQMGLDISAKAAQIEPMESVAEEEAAAQAVFSSEQAKATNASVSKAKPPVKAKKVKAKVKAKTKAKAKKRVKKPRVA